MQATVGDAVGGAAAAVGGAVGGVVGGAATTVGDTRKVSVVAPDPISPITSASFFPRSEARLTERILSPTRSRPS